MTVGDVAAILCPEVDNIRGGEQGERVLETFARARNALASLASGIFKIKEAEEREAQADRRGPLVDQIM